MRFLAEAFYLMTAFKAIFAAMSMLMVLLAAAPLAFADEPDSSAIIQADRDQLSKDLLRQYNKAVRSQRLQTELPLEQDAEIKPEREPFVLSQQTATILLIIAVIVIVVIIVLTLRKNLWSNDKSKKSEHEEATEENKPDEAVAQRMDNARLTADDLADQGRYTEAMHILLLQSVNELRRRLAVSIADSLTSREILQRIGLTTDGKQFFGDIIRRVEIYYFGTHEPGAEEYAACRASYYALTDILRRGTTA